MATAPSGLLNLDLSGTFGAVFWAFVVSTVLFGISVVQGYFYYMHNRDPLGLKLFVALMLALDFTTTALASQSLHYYLIMNFGNPFALQFVTKPYIAEYVVTAIVTLLSQLFYASRVHVAIKQSVRYGIPVIICSSAFGAFAFAIALTVRIFATQRLIAALERKEMMVIMGMHNGLAALCDIVATIAMCVFLASQKTVFKQTRKIVAFLLFISINRGVLVAIAQIGFLTSYLAAPSKIYWMPFHLSISKLHVNTLLAMLNSRESLRSKISQTRISQDHTTFNSQVGRERDRDTHIPRSLSAKGSLGLSGIAYQLESLSKVSGQGRTDSSQTALASPSKFSGDERRTVAFGDERQGLELGLGQTGIHTARDRDTSTQRRSRDDPDPDEDESSSLNV